MVVTNVTIGISSSTIPAKIKNETRLNRPASAAPAGKK
jgi:hypothetical protein